MMTTSRAKLISYYNKKRFTTVSLTLLFSLPSSFVIAKEDVINKIKTNSAQGLTFSTPTSFSTLERPQHLSILAVGDVLLHKPLQVQAYKHPEGHISLWKQLEGIIKSVDMAYANLEGPVAPGINKSGKETKDPGKNFDDVVYTSYPMLNYHESLIEDLVKSGFDVVSTANNHSLDRRSIGVDKTIELLEKHGLAYTGTLSTQENYQTIWHTVVEKNNFRIAWLACTFSTNGLPDPNKQVPEIYDHILGMFGTSNLLALPGSAPQKQNQLN